MSHYPPVHLSAAEAEKSRFCFMGEFGYEVVSWMPYLLFLKQKLGIRIRTMGRPGSSIFYYFSDDHIELGDKPGDCWGETTLYDGIATKFPDEQLIFPGPEPINQRRISVDGCDWRNRDIHRKIDTTHYALLDYKHVQSLSPKRRPTVVINNKYFLQWPALYSEPVNFIDRDSLVALNELFTLRGYDVIYNHFVESTVHDKHLAIDDTGIFANDLRAQYAHCRSVEDRNRLQLSVYNSADLIIGPQGGNIYLPAVCRKPLYIVQRAGQFMDYPELARVYGVDLQMFYEARHLVCWLAQTLAAAA